MGFFKNLFRKFSQPEPEPMASNSLDISISSECYEVKEPLHKRWVICYN